MAKGKNPWFRLYVDFASNPNIQTLPEVMQRRYIMLLCMKSNGDLPLESPQNDLETIKFCLRIGLKKLLETKQKLIERNLITDNWDIVGWEKHQYISDTSTERVRKFRNKRNASETFHVTKGETPPDTEQIQNRYRTENKESEVTSKAVDPIDMKFAKIFLNNVRKRKPGGSPNLRKWADEFRKMREIDAISIPDIQKAIEYLDKSEPNSSGFCWGDVVLSPMKLRKQLKGSLYPAMQKDRQKKSRPEISDWE